jgi:hypothetical protein
MTAELSRRALLGLVASAGVGAAFAAKAQVLGEALARPDLADSQRWVFLRRSEVDFLVAACDRILPEDEFPSASQAGVVDYIDLQLASAWGEGEGFYLQGPHLPGRAVPGQGYQLGLSPAELYRAGIEGIQSGLDQPFEALAPDEQDRILTMLEEGEADAGPIPGKTFFDFLRRNTLEGYFTDPVYGGNRDMVGWRMLGFPGPNAYYTGLVDQHGLEYLRAPAGMTYPAGAAAPRPITRRNGEVR